MPQIYRFCLPLLLLALLLGLTACATRHDSKLPKPQTDDKAAGIWQLYTVRSSTAEGMAGPFRINANLRYTDSSDKNTRVSSLLWGNGQADSPYPLRLDLLASVGTVAARAREDSTSFTVFVPDEKTAWIHAGSARTLASFGVPIPLSLSDLTMLLTGRSGLLFIPASTHNAAGIPPKYTLTENGVRYIVPDARLPGIIELSESGVPIFWKELCPDGWSIEFEPDKTNPLLPNRLRVSHPKGYSALIVVREITHISHPYSTAQMSLVLPPGTRRKSLEL